MTNQLQEEEPFVFGLDIGTRSVVGIVGYKEKEQFHIIAHHTVAHKTRAMIDGQIHDIKKVAEAVQEVKEALEKQLDRPLTEVCIAAAGRVLKTADVTVDLTFNADTEVTEDHVYSLELQGVEQAHKQVASEDSFEVAYHCVGYSVVKTFLNDYVISSLVGHKAKKVAAKILATFLPQEVIDSLYAVVEHAGLKVVGLTLEPIAAIQVAIPEQFRLLNIALVDVGAGTSDIAITKEGSIIAFGMIPYAGDEITEQIVHHYLVDFSTAEKIKLKLTKNKTITFKDIMGTPHKCEPKEILDNIQPAIRNMAERIAEKIKSLNGNKSTNAVFCVGGGGQISSFTSQLAKMLQLPEERVALRGSEVLQFVLMKRKGLKKEPTIVTPIGIALSAYYQNSNFIQVKVNGQEVKLYNNHHLKVIDVAAMIGFDYQNLFPKRGQSLTYILNGERRVHKGLLGEAAKIFVNHQEVSINHPIAHKDEVVLLEATRGQEVTLTVSQLKEYAVPITFQVKGRKVRLPRLCKINGRTVGEGTVIQANDTVEIHNYYPFEDLITCLDLQIENQRFRINGQPVTDKLFVYENDHIDWLEEKSLLEQTLEEVAVMNDKKISPLIVEEGETQEIVYEVRSVELSVQVNGEEIQLRNKSNYIFVDIFESIDFDLSRLKGKLITTLNGKPVAYTDPLHAGDVIEIYWEG